MTIEQRDNTLGWIFLILFILVPLVLGGCSLSNKQIIKKCKECEKAGMGIIVYVDVFGKPVDIVCNPKFSKPKPIESDSTGIKTEATDGFNKAKP